jgi:hypothetical protein
MAESNVPPAPVMVAMDVACFVLGAVPGVLAWLAVGFYERALWQRWDASAPFVLASLAAPLVALAAFLFVVLVLRLLSPRMREGVYPMGLNRGIVAWYCQLALARAAAISGLSPLIRATHLTRFLYFRALGAKFALRVNTAHDFLVMDAPMLTVRKGASISLHATICCHTFSGRRLALLPVEIGEDVFIGGNAFIGPHTRIGDGSWIGMGNVVYGEELPPNTRIENFAWAHGKPKE